MVSCSEFVDHFGKLKAFPRYHNHLFWKEVLSRHLYFEHYMQNEPYQGLHEFLVWNLTSALRCFGGKCPVMWDLSSESLLLDVPEPLSLMPESDQDARRKQARDFTRIM